MNAFKFELRRPEKVKELSKYVVLEEPNIDPWLNLALGHEDASQVYQMLGKIPYHAGKEFKEIWKKDAAE